MVYNCCEERLFQHSHVHKPSSVNQSVFPSKYPLATVKEDFFFSAVWLSTSFAPILLLSWFSHHIILTQFSQPLQNDLIPFISVLHQSLSPPSSTDALPAWHLWELLPLSRGWDSCVSFYHRSRFWPQSVLLGTILNFFHPFPPFSPRTGSYLWCGEAMEWAVHGGKGGGSGDQGEEEGSSCFEVLMP